MKVCAEFQNISAISVGFRVCGDALQPGSDEVKHYCTLPPGHLTDGHAHACDCGTCWSNLGEDQQCDR